MKAAHVLMVAILAVAPGCKKGPPGGAEPTSAAGSYSCMSNDDCQVSLTPRVSDDMS